MAVSSTRDLCVGDYVMVTDGSLKHLKGKRGWVSQLVPGVRRRVEVELPGMPCSVGFAADQLQKAASLRSRADLQAPD